MKNYWQIGAGVQTGGLEDIFIKLNVALIGPGEYGDYFDNKDKYSTIEGGHFIKTFAEEVKIGDIFVLKRSVNPSLQEWEIIAVGEVVGPYRYEPIFKDVGTAGWQMQHCRRVLWKVPQTKVIVKGGGVPVRFQRIEETNPLKKEADKILAGSQ